MPFSLLPRGLFSAQTSMVLMAGSFSIVATLFVIWMLAQLPAPGWRDWKPAHCMPDGCFCERPRDGWIRQPANTVSNLAFSVVGLWVLAAGASRGTGALTSIKSQKFAAFCGCYAFALFTTGLGSAFYHASLTFAGEWLDNVGMHQCVLASFVYSLAVNKHTHVSAPGMILAFFLLNALSSGTIYAFPEARRYVFFGMFAAVLLAPRHAAHADSRYLYAAAAIFGVSFALWIADITHSALCLPDSLWQLHAWAWHCGCALAAWSLYLYHQSELETGKKKE